MPESCHPAATTPGPGAYRRVGRPDGRPHPAVDGSRRGWHAGGMPDNDANEDLKAKMREALERKQANDRGVPKDKPLKEKAHGSEVGGGAAPKMHRRKAGGGGA
ncbi:MAG TPA: DUF5302 domain-containing protein [Marmoricola sp.]